MEHTATDLIKVSGWGITPSKPTSGAALNGRPRYRWCPDVGQHQRMRKPSSPTKLRRKGRQTALVDLRHYVEEAKEFKAFIRTTGQQQVERRTEPRAH
jgi:hypothetical protein